ncbi:hypothetical protein [Emticicia sp. BO119]|uniref:hypothetical protein n=1 Tax=Emticicia sp. BO119 TaxID=2757768 RepID=UPI001824C891|nr:hypothetical protein [Emticicia sp. BO119]MBA4849040.1 hypothetical protein [Emticicia sp. BO119]
MFIPGLEISEIINSLIWLTTISYFVYLTIRLYDKFTPNLSPQNRIEAGILANSILKDILKNSKFNTIFNTSLPKGEKDEQLGIDYIPFMIGKLEDNKVEFKRKANQFFYTSFSVGFHFICSIFLFAYLLIKNHEYSFAASLEKIRNENQEIIVLLSNDNQLDKEIQIKKNLEEIRTTMEVFDSTSTDVRAINNAITNFYKDKNLITLKEVIQEYSTNQIFSDRINNEITKLNTLLNEEITFKQQLYKSALNINNLIKIAEIETQKPQYQTNEIIKRVSIGLIIGTFLFSILRFLIKQYNSNIEHQIRCENEDLVIRKLYIALKISSPDNEQRKIIIEKFAEKTNREAKDGDSLNSEEVGILKETIAAILKKL